MKSLFSIFVLCYFLQSCSYGVPFESVNLNPLLNDSNSKVWLIDKVIIGDKNYAPKLNVDKDIMVFYANGKCLFQPLKSLGEINGKKGKYTLYSDEEKLFIYFNDQNWEFDLTTITEDQIALKPTAKSDLKYKMVLIPFPEF